MKPFKDAYYEACGLWMRKNPAARITEYDIASLVGDAFPRVARAEIAIKGFQCTGIHPLNPNVFTKLDFLPSQMTDIAMDHDIGSTSRKRSTVSNRSCDEERSTTLVVESPISMDKMAQPSYSSEIIQKLSPIPRCQ